MTLYPESLKNSFEDIYDLNRLKQFDERCQYDIKLMKENIEKIKKRQQELHDHAQVVAQTEFKRKVVIWRRENYENRIQFELYIEDKPILPEEVGNRRRVYAEPRIFHRKCFKGMERRQAIEYAKSLAEENKCELKMIGFKK